MSQILNKRILGLCSWYGGRKNHHQRSVLDHLLSDLAKQPANHTVITGDLVNLSLREEFLTARHWLDQFTAPDALSVVPGNHDAYVYMPEEAGLASWSPFTANNKTATKYHVDSADPFPFVRVFGEIALVGLSSACPTPWFFHGGRIGADQLGALEEILRRLGADGLFRIILIHHPPIDLGGLKQFQLGLWDVKKLHEILQSAGAELILCGHLHDNVTSQVETQNGHAYVIGVPSASVGAHPRKPLARYNLYHIARNHTAWTVDIVGRGVSPRDGKICQIESTQLTWQAAH